VKRTPINKVSKKRQRENAQRRKVLIEKYGLPDTWRCELGSIIGSACHGPIHGHELLKRSRGGSITNPDNIMLACDYHNGWVELYPSIAEQLHLSRHSWEGEPDVKKDSGEQDGHEDW
jgi:hypothetical protein